MRRLLLLLALAAPWSASADEVQVESERMELYHAERRAEFIGEAHVTSGAFELRCDRLVVYYREGREELERADAFGHVRIRNGEVRGSSEKAHLDKGRDVVILIDNAVVEQPEGRARGDRIVHHLESLRTEVQQRERGRVQLHIEEGESTGEKP